MRVPDFFIVGAPKCGTTALYTYLSSHPGIFMSPVKEPHHFSTDIRPVALYESFDKYLRLFASARDHQLCGEASTSYLLSEIAIGKILRANPAARLIAMVRSPLDMLPSVHNQALYTFYETEPQFEAAWHRSSSADDRPLRWRHPPNYKALGRLGLQIQRLFATAPREQIHIVVFDEFSADPDRVYRDVLAFLKVDMIEPQRFPVVNPRKRHRLPWVSRFLMKPPFPLDRAKETLKAAFPSQMKAIGKHVYGMNISEIDRVPPSAGLKSVMAQEFKNDIDLLGSLLGRDLSHWYKVLY